MEHNIIVSIHLTIHLTCDDVSYVHDDSFVMDVHNLVLYLNSIRLFLSF